MKITTGSRELDEWLSGGFETDVITTIYGPAGSGKTNLCVMAAACQASQEKQVLFIDTEGGFSIERLKQLTPGEVIKNILLLKVTNFYEQYKAFQQLPELIKKNRNISLIIVDSIVMLYRLALAEAKKKNKEEINKVNRLLVKQMLILNEMARKKNIPSIITDQVYSEFLSQEDFEAGKERKTLMVGGDIFRYWSKCIIEIQNLPFGRKKAILRKHRSMPEKEFFFKITGEGIKKI